MELPELTSINQLRWIGKPPAEGAMGMATDPDLEDQENVPVTPDR